MFIDFLKNCMVLYCYFEENFFSIVKWFFIRLLEKFVIVLIWEVDLLICGFIFFVFLRFLVCLLFSKVCIFFCVKFVFKFMLLVGYLYVFFVVLISMFVMCVFGLLVMWFFVCFLLLFFMVVFFGKFGNCMW